MGMDVYLIEPKVMDEPVHWGIWYLSTNGMNGLGMDVLKHMDRDFTMARLEKVREKTRRKLFAVGEFQTHDLAELRKFIGEDRILILFDVFLHFALQQASWSRREYSLRAVLADTLVDVGPMMAATFTEGHDAQKGQPPQSPVTEWSRPAAYTLVPLQETDRPCMFRADLNSAGEEHPIAPASGLKTLMRLRVSHAHGIQRGASDNPELIGRSCEGLSGRKGEEDTPSTSVAALISQSGTAVKALEIGTRHTG